MNRLQVGKIAKTVVYWQPIRIFTLHYWNRRPSGLLPLSRLPCVLDEFPGKASRGILSWECVQRTPPWNATNRRKFCFEERGSSSTVHVRTGKRIKISGNYGVSRYRLLIRVNTETSRIDCVKLSGKVYLGSRRDYVYFHLEILVFRTEWKWFEN